LRGGGHRFVDSADLQPELSQVPDFRAQQGNSAHFVGFETLSGNLERVVSYRHAGKLKYTILIGYDHGGGARGGVA
jgi:hypothetical protein